jgi:hypothetical protein
LADKAAAGQGTRVILGHGHADQLPAASGAMSERSAAHSERRSSWARRLGARFA